MKLEQLVQILVSKGYLNIICRDESSFICLLKEYSRQPEHCCQVDLTKINMLANPAFGISTSQRKIIALNNLGMLEILKFLTSTSQQNDEAMDHF